MKSSTSKENLVLQNVIVHYMLSFKHVCLIAVICPLMVLVICFITANVFQPDEVHETHCKVSYNVCIKLKNVISSAPTGLQYCSFNKCDNRCKTANVPVAY